MVILWCYHSSHIYWVTFHCRKCFSFPSLIRSFVDINVDSWIPVSFNRAPFVTPANYRDVHSVLESGFFVPLPCHSQESTSLLSDTTACCRFIVYFLCPTPRIINFSKGPLFAWLEKKMAFRNQDLRAGFVYCYSLSVSIAIFDSEEQEFSNNSKSNPTPQGTFSISPL